MWTPRPVRAFRYAGSVATSVLPSPVAISAIVPAWSTMPPMSWTSKWRISTVRRAASRHTANASGRTSSSGSPPSIRFLNSSDFARRPASSSGASDASSALMAWTTGIIRLTSRSCLVPKIFFSRASIMRSSLYRARSRRRPTQKLAGVAPRGIGHPLARHHAGDLLDARLSGQVLGADAGPAGADALRHLDVVGGAGGDRRQVRHAEDLASLRGRDELLGDDRRHSAADARVHLVEDHRGHAVGARQNGLERQHRARELAARRDADERAHVLARVGRQTELDPVEPARPDLFQRRRLDGDLEAGSLHAELPQLARSLRGEGLGGEPATVRERDRRLRELRVQLAEHTLLLGQDLLVTAQALQLDRRLLPEREHRRLRVAVLPFEAREDVEALVHRFEPAGRHEDARPQRADRRERVLDERPGAVYRVGRSGERRIDPGELAQEARGAMQTAHRRVLVVVEKPSGLGEAGRQPLGVLEPSALAPQLLLLTRPETCPVELGELEAEEILTLSPLALGGPRALELGPRHAVLREQLAHAVAQLVGVRETVQQVELAGRLEQPLVLVLAVDFDQLVTEALQQADGHGRVVDKGAVAPGASELPAYDELALVRGEPRVLEHRRRRAARRHLEHGLHGRRLGVGADHVGLRAGAADQEDRVDEHGLPGARLAGQHVEPGPERRGHGLDHGEVADTDLTEHVGRCEVRDPPTTSGIRVNTAL